MNMLWRHFGGNGSLNIGDNGATVQVTRISDDRRIRASAHMSYQFEFDSKNRVLRVTFDGLVTDQIITEFYACAGEYVARTMPRATIADFSGITAFVAAPSTLFILAKSAPIMKDPEIIRIIIAPGQHVFGMSRMFQMVGESTRPSLRVVRSQEEAFVMLSLQDTQFNPVNLE